jgi:protein-S-isoprenylcysteine O-methyltransferase Ste14
MSRSLNLKRVQLSGALAVGTVLGMIVLPVTWPEGTLTHKILWAVASVLIGLAALGRLYATAFLGGFKNQKLVTEGPFSVTRNPLYFFSFVGVCGIALATAQILIILLVPPLFWVLIHRLMQREEGFLREKFGEAYQVYCAQTPRFLPRLSLYQAPESMKMCPQYLRNALKDAVWWFTALPLLDLLVSVFHR